MLLSGDKLYLHSIPYKILLNNGTYFYVGKLLKREKGYSHFFETDCLYNNIFEFEFMPNKNSCVSMDNWYYSNIFSVSILPLHNDYQTT